MNKNIDGGYAWVILVCCFFSQFVFGGSCAIYGQFYLELSDTFHESAESLMSVVAVQSLTIYGASIVAGGLCSRFAVRTVGAAGVLLCTTGYVISAFSQHLISIIFGYGFIVGLGISLHYMAAMTIVQMYFEKKRSLAAGLSMSGEGFGIMVYAPTIRFFIESFGWRGAMLMLGAMYLQCLVFVVLMRQPTDCASLPPQTADVFSSNISLAIGTNDVEITEQEETRDEDDLELQGNECKNYKLLAHDYIEGKSSQERKDAKDEKACESSEHAYKKDQDSKRPKPREQDYNEDKSSQERRDEKEQEKCKSSEYMDTMGEEKRNLQEHTDTRTQDITYPDGRTNISNPENQTKLQRLLTRIDLKLYFNIYVLLFFLASSTMSVCSGIPYNFLPVKCVEDGLTKSDAAVIITFMGLADMVGRWTFGATGLRVNVTVLYVVSCGMAGLSCMSLAWLHSFAGMASAAVLFAFSQGGVFTVGAQSLIQYVGVAKFSRVFGFILMGKAIGYGSAGPFGAYLSAEFGSSSVAFFVVGFFALAGSLITCGILSLGKCSVTAAMRPHVTTQSK